MMIGCDEPARIVGRFCGSDSEPLLITYCPKHRKYGENLIDMWLVEVYRHKFSMNLSKVRHDICMDGEFEFCPDCQKRLVEFLKDKAEEMRELDT